MENINRIRICAAPDCNNERCSVSSYHCKMHNQLLHPKYVEYKSLEENISYILNGSIKSNNVETLLKQYSKVEQVYNKRKTFREIGFKREHWRSLYQRSSQLACKSMICCTGYWP